MGRDSSSLEGKAGHYQEKVFQDASIGQAQGSGGGLDVLSNHQLERGLKSRHIQFLALGGAIGTG